MFTKFKGKFIVENVKTWYNEEKLPIMYRKYFKPTLYWFKYKLWSNVKIVKSKFVNNIKLGSSYKQNCLKLLIDYELIRNVKMRKYKTHDFRMQILRNCVNPYLANNLLYQLINNEIYE